MGFFLSPHDTELLLVLVAAAPCCSVLFALVLLVCSILILFFIIIPAVIHCFYSPHDVLSDIIYHVLEYCEKAGLYNTG